MESSEWSRRGGFVVFYDTRNATRSLVSFYSPLVSFSSLLVSFSSPLVSFYSPLVSFSSARLSA